MPGRPRGFTRLPAGKTYLTPESTDQRSCLIQHYGDRRGLVGTGRFELEPFCRHERAEGRAGVGRRNPERSEGSLPIKNFTVKDWSGRADLNCARHFVTDPSLAFLFAPPLRSGAHTLGCSRSADQRSCLIQLYGDRRGLVGTGRFELPTPRTPSECSTRLSHVPTIGDPLLKRGFSAEGSA